MRLSLLTGLTSAIRPDQGSSFSGTICQCEPFCYLYYSVMCKDRVVQRHVRTMSAKREPKTGPATRCAVATVKLHAVLWQLRKVYFHERLNHAVWAAFILHGCLPLQFENKCALETRQELQGRRDTQVTLERAALCRWVNGKKEICKKKTTSVDHVCSHAAENYVNSWS